MIMGDELYIKLFIHIIESIYEKINEKEKEIFIF